ncbi:hypothetical protein B0H17DRAFT_1135864 [Mycena rosella]|uniref:Uncharacterized protein n=1 Tax=Mycena rosella TaxID=1033263 RepID=A0AAD7GF21_MYCRO|nr:hypothetical protein B0H17DRAFT_1135864 [Mycena rosella]
MTGRTLYDGNMSLMRANIACHLQRGIARGVLQALDFPDVADPVLRASSKSDSSKSGKQVQPRADPAYPNPHSLLSKAKVGVPISHEVMEIIKRDVGLSALVLNAALRVPLPLSTAAQPPLRPAFESIIHIGRVNHLKSAVVDIAHAFTQFGVADVAFASLTPNRLLFQPKPLSGSSVTGFGPARALQRGQYWLEGTADPYDEFIRRRRAFLGDWWEGPEDTRSAGMRTLEREWLWPLWTVVGQAHLGHRFGRGWGAVPFRASLRLEVRRCIS